MQRLIIVIGVLIFSVWLNNNSLLATKPQNAPQLIAHRGVHQNFFNEGLTNESCTAEMIYPPEHDFIENTVPSIQAAIDAGAAVNEIDVQRTKDGHFAVFHDHTLDCRTEASGYIRNYTLAELKQLDPGYGYTSDSGRTYPFRGKYIGAIPSLREIVDQFPEHTFILNLKSNKPEDAIALLSTMSENPKWDERIMAIISGRRAVEQIRTQQSEIRSASRHTGQQCLKHFMLTGWSGFIPDTCHNTVFAVPMNYRHLTWGWPYRLTARLKSVNTPVIVLGPFERGDPGTTGVNHYKEFEALPQHLDAYIMTDRIDLIGPLIPQQSGIH